MLSRPSRCAIGWIRTTFDAVATSHQLALLVPLGPEQLRKVADLPASALPLIAYPYPDPYPSPYPYPDPDPSPYPYPLRPTDDTAETPSESFRQLALS